MKIETGTHKIKIKSWIREAVYELTRRGRERLTNVRGAQKRGRDWIGLQIDFRFGKFITDRIREYYYNLKTFCASHVSQSIYIWALCCNISRTIGHLI